MVLWTTHTMCCQGFNSSGPVRTESDSVGHGSLRIVDAGREGGRGVAARRQQTAVLGVVREVVRRPGVDLEGVLGGPGVGVALHDHVQVRGEGLGDGADDPAVDEDLHLGEPDTNVRGVAAVVVGHLRAFGEEGEEEVVRSGVHRVCDSIGPDVGQADGDVALGVREGDLVRDLDDREEVRTALLLRQTTEHVHQQRERRDVHVLTE